MELSNKFLLKQIFLNIALIFMVFSCTSFFLFKMGEIRNFDVIYFIGSVLSAAYVLIVRNPYNYMAFIVGILANLILIYSLYDINVNMAFTYAFVFIPCQIYSFIVWRKAYYKKMNADKVGVLEDGESDAIEPHFLSLKGLYIVIFLFVLVFILNSVFFYFYDFVNDDVILLLLNGMFFTLSVFSNLLLIRKITDSWVLWVLFSVCGIVIALYSGNIDYYLLSIFIVFLIVNAIALYKWIHITPKENYGWLKSVLKN